MVRKHYVESCIKRKEHNTAIELLEQGKQIDKSYPGYVANYSLQLKNLYKELGNQKLYKEELWLLVLEYKAGNIELYEELKSLYTEREWIEKRELIFRKLPPYVKIDRLYEIEKLYDRLIKLVLNSNGLYMLMDYEEILKDTYHEELFRKYETVVKDMATHSSGRKQYQDIVSILRRMQEYPEGKHKVSEIITDWQLRYKNRPAMMDELGKI